MLHSHCTNCCCLIKILVILICFKLIQIENELWRLQTAPSNHVRTCIHHTAVLSCTLCLLGLPGIQRWIRTSMNLSVPRSRRILLRASGRLVRFPVYLGYILMALYAWFIPYGLFFLWYTEDTYIQISYIKKSGLSLNIRNGSSTAFFNF